MCEECHLHSLDNHLPRRSIEMNSAEASGVTGACTSPVLPEEVIKSEEGENRDDLLAQYRYGELNRCTESPSRSISRSRGFGSALTIASLPPHLHSITQSYRGPLPVGLRSTH